MTSKDPQASRLAADRDSIVEYLEAQLIGPSKGAEETLKSKDIPHLYYLMGALFPQGVGSGEIEEEEDDRLDDDPIGMAYQLMPSSVGLSFYVPNAANAAIRVDLKAAVYEKDDNCWRRRDLATREHPESHTLSPLVQTVDSALNGRAQLVSVWRQLGSGYLVTVTMVNPRKVDGKKLDPEDVIHQVWLRCTLGNDAIASYPSPNRYSWDAEEEELALIYQNKKTFAIGHGCAANWDTSSHGDTVDWVETSFIPSYEVPPVTADLPSEHPLSSSEVFSLQYLSDGLIPWDTKRNRLKEFIDGYSSWIEQQSELALPEGLEMAGDRILRRQKAALERMESGLEFLSDNPAAQECFLLANKIMLMQMLHSGDGYGGVARDANSRRYEEPDYGAAKNFRWRPFQLAFQLLALESVGNVNSVDRNVADLIWFPTGGGKTEAYLSVAAFELFHRRMQFGADVGAGTAVILRYTLRLLTTQQFQRAAAMILACESIRRSDPEKWGEEPFSLGLWVGQPTTPNYFDSASEHGKGALQKFQFMREQAEPENPFQLLQCPWCGTRIVPQRHSDSPGDYGIRCDSSRFEFYCPTSTCPFNDVIPIQVIDEGLYRNPPSFLIGTIDKFAQLAWRDDASAFFSGGMRKRRPPSMVIQDELHLISGPLGTIAGVYEAAIDVVMQRFGANPKYIAATATIRRAAEQVQKLYARDCMIFPPSGVTAEDSFFSREESADGSKPGRLYIGVMGQYHRPVTSLVLTSAALAQSVIEISSLSNEAQDGYWTQVIFHNSRRELGKTMTLARDDIPGRANVIATSPEVRRLQPVEMSANIASGEIPKVLEQLKAPKGSPDVIDILPCTNMFSVGVDVKRLGLIVMNGQPKTTSEYIQASSRVGRDRVPGLVVAFYPNNKARDRSQYESFIPYHQALYRAVEPTSVTPYAAPAMERALHAALVIVMRYVGGLSGNDGARAFDKDDPHIADLIDALRRRILQAEGDDEKTWKEIKGYLDSCIDAWHEKATASQRGGQPLRYESRGSSNFESLMTDYEPGVLSKPSIPWPTLNSMRNVDGECKIYVWGEE